MLPPAFLAYSTVELLSHNVTWQVRLGSTKSREFVGREAVRWRGGHDSDSVESCKVEEIAQGSFANWWKNTVRTLVKTKILFANWRKPKRWNRSNLKRKASNNRLFSNYIEHNSNWGKLRSELAHIESAATWFMSNAIGSSRESNPSRKIYHLSAVPQGHVNINFLWIMFLFQFFHSCHFYFNKDQKNEWTLTPLDCLVRGIPPNFSRWLLDRTKQQQEKSATRFTSISESWI